MKKKIRILKSKLMVACTVFIFNIMNCTVAYASTLNDVNNQAKGFVSKLGGFIMFLGAMKIALSIKNDDATAKAGGAGLLFAGFLVSLICTNLIPALS